MKLEVYSIDGKKNGKSVELEVQPKRKSAVKFAGQQKSCLSKKVQEMHVVVISSLHCCVEGVQPMALDLARTILA
jgi:hypothetical protein